MPPEVTRPMRHHLAAVVAALSLLAILAMPVLAKEGMEARLDAPIPAGTPPGTTLDVGWTTFMPDGGGGTVPFSGAPVSIALTEPGASEPATVVPGDEYPSGSGHFTATIVVPPGGIAADGVAILLRGESCEDGVCQRSDLPFVLVGEVLTTAAAAAPVPAPSAVAPVATPTVTAPAADTTPWSLVALAAGAAVIGAVFVAIRVGRRRAAVIATGTLAAVALLLAAASGVLAKQEGVIATFDPPIPDEPVPGTMLELSWTMLVEPTDGSAATEPYEATPLIVRVTSRSGVPLDVPATHLGGGRYEVAFAVPETGLGALDLGLPDDGGSLFLLAEVFDAPPIIRTIGPATTDTGIAPAVLLGVVALVLAGAAVLVSGRRRRAGAVPPSTAVTGRTSTSGAGQATPTR